MRRTTFAPPRRRRSPARLILWLVLAGLVGFVIWLSVVDTEVPTQRIEQDVTNEALAK